MYYKYWLHTYNILILTIITYLKYLKITDHSLLIDNYNINIIIIFLHSLNIFTARF